MHNTKWTWLLITVALLAPAGCSKKETPAGPVRETAEKPTPTPIDPATVGEIAGRVLFEGRKPARQRITMDQDPACLQKHHGPVFAEDGQVNGNGTLPNVFVYVKAGAERYVFAPPPDPVVLAQDGCMYKPHVLGIMVGQRLKVVNLDDTTHNIHPMPKDNREWNMAQMPGAAPIEQKFSHPEIMVPIKCNQHPWMRAWVGVTSNPFYAVTGSDGMFAIKGLPPGQYTLEAWTAAFGTREQKVAVGAKQSTTVDFKFTAP